MAAGRIMQMRLHAVSQAALVWAVTEKLPPQQLDHFVRTGLLEETTEVMRPSPPAMENLFASMQRRIDGQ